MSDPEDDRRRPGRPKKVESGSTVSSWISERDHDRLIHLASAERISVSEFVRRTLTKRLTDR